MWGFLRRFREHATHTRAVPPDVKIRNDFRDSVRQITEFGLIYRVFEFDEAGYLARNPDVCAMIQAGRVASGYEHWLDRGAAEGRLQGDGRPFPLPEHMNREALLLQYQITIGDEARATQSLACWIAGQETSLRDTLGPGFDVVALHRELAEAEEPLVPPPEFCLVAFYAVLLDEMRDPAATIDRYRAVGRICAHLIAARKDYWAGRVVIWARLRAGIAARSVGRFEDARAELAIVRQAHWRQPTDIGLRVDVPPPAFVRATYELCMIEAEQGDPTACVMHAIALTNRLFQWGHNWLRAILYDDVLRVCAALEAATDLRGASVCRALDRLVEHLPYLPWLMIRDRDGFDRKRAEAEAGAGFDHDIIVMVGDSTSESMRYRAVHVADAARCLGLRAATCAPSDLDEIRRLEVSAKTFVVFRSDLNETVKSAIEMFRTGSARVVFDIDDLFFDPTLADSIAGIKLLDEVNARGAILAIEAFRRTLLACDIASGPTAVLVEEFERLGRPAIRIPITTGRLDEALARCVPQRRPNGRVVIGYFSGSWTHQHDILECTSAICEVMAAHDHVDLLLVGHLSPPAELASFAGRVQTAGFRSHPEMLALYRSTDISIAPLERGNRFCDAKSPTKIFEAGLFRVPTVASAAPGFLSAISHGRDGMIAHSREDWKACIAALARSDRMRLEMGARAFGRARDEFSSGALQRAVANHYGAPSVGGRDRAFRTKHLRILCLVETDGASLKAASSNLRWIENLRFFGHELSVLADTGAGWMHLAERAEAIRAADVVLAVHPLSFDPALIEQAFGTAVVHASFAADQVDRMIDRTQTHVGRPGDLPTCVVYGEVGRIGRIAAMALPGIVACDLPVERFDYWPRHVAREPRTLLFTVEVGMNRDLVAAVDRLLQRLVQSTVITSLILIGERQALDGLATPAERHPLPEQSGVLAELYSRAALGLVVASFTPVRRRYEMMACEVPLIDVGRWTDLVNREALDRSVEVLSATISRLMADPQERRSLVAVGRHQVDRLPNELESARRLEVILLQHVEDMEDRKGRGVT